MQVPKLGGSFSKSLAPLASQPASHCPQGQQGFHTHTPSSYFMQLLASQSGVSSTVCQTGHELTSQSKYPGSSAIYVPMLPTQNKGSLSSPAVKFEDAVRVQGQDSRLSILRLFNMMGWRGAENLKANLKQIVVSSPLA